MAYRLSGPPGLKPEDTMKDILEVLLCQLARKGVMPGKVPGLLRDTLECLSSGRYYTIDGLNAKLEELGWTNDILDPHTMELIVILLENECIFEKQDRCSR